MPATKLFGRGTGHRPIYARAALLHEDGGGRSTLDGELLSLVFKRLKRGEEALEIVLVARDPAQALLLHLPSGLRLVGIVSEGDLSAASLPDNLSLAVLSGVVGATEEIADGDLLILDPERGRVVVEPEADEFVRLQAEHGNRPRILLGAAHVVAQTLSGRQVPVWATVRFLAEVAAAVEAGADGLIVVPGGDLLPETEEEREVTLARFLAIADAIGGGDLTIAASPDLLDLIIVVSLAPHARLRWAIAPSQLSVPLTELREHMELVVGNLRVAPHSNMLWMNIRSTLPEYLANIRRQSDSELRAKLEHLIPKEVEDERAAAVPLLVAAMTDLTDFDAEGWDEILLPATVAETLTVPDTFTLPPLWIRLGDGAELSPSAAAVAVGIIVAPEFIQAAKENLRSQEY